MTSSLSGWRYWALGKAGRVDVILREFRDKWATLPSVTLNNTIQENFRSSTDSTAQWSHCALAPIYILYDEILGLRPLDPGCKRIELRPQLGDLPDLELVAYTPPGPIQFHAQLRGNFHDVTVTLPAGCEAELVLPAGVNVDFERIQTSEQTNHPRYRLPAGQWTFTVPLASFEE